MKCAAINQSLISHTVSVDVKHYIYLLTAISSCKCAVVGAVSVQLAL